MYQVHRLLITEASTIHRVIFVKFIADNVGLLQFQVLALCYTCAIWMKNS